MIPGIKIQLDISNLKPSTVDIFVIPTTIS